MFQLRPLILPFLLILSLAGSAAAETLRIATDGDYPPFSMRNAEGELVGFDIDIAKALCAEMQVECSLSQQAWDGMIPGLLAKKFDVIIASMSITEDRKRHVAFTDKYWSAVSRFVGQEGKFTSDTPEALEDKVIGVLGGSIQDAYVTALYTDSDIRRYGNQEEVYLDLTAGRLDATLVAGFQADLNFLSQPEGKGFAFFGAGHTDPKYFGVGVGIALRKEDAALVERLNAAIAAIRKNGTYQAINAKYTTVDIYGE